MYVYVYAHVIWIVGGYYGKHGVINKTTSGVYDSSVKDAGQESMKAGQEEISKGGHEERWCTSREKLLLCASLLVEISRD